MSDNKNVNYLCCASLNVRGISGDNDATKKKLEQIKSVIKSSNFNVIFLQELKIHHESKDGININWKKYFKKWNFISDDNKETGILIRSYIPITKIGKFKSKLCGSQWCTWCIVYCKGRKICLGSYYRSPSKRDTLTVGGRIISKNRQADIRTLQVEINYIKKMQKVNEFVIGGDVNIESMLWNRNCKNDSKNVNELLEFMEINQLKLINNNSKPTHAVKRDGKITGYGIIDLVLVSKSLEIDVNGYDTNSYSNGLNIDSLDLQWVDNVSDHFLVKWNINKKINNFDNIHETWRLNSDKWEEYSDLLKYQLKDINKNNIDKCGINNTVEYLTKCMRFCCKSTIGIKKYTSNSNDWINKDIITVKKLTKKYRRKIEKIKRKGKKSDKLKKLYNYCKYVRNKMVKVARKIAWWKHGNEINDNINDSKTFYKLRDRVLGENKKDLPPFRRKDGTYTDDTIEKAIMMHDKFNQKHKENEYSDEMINFHKSIDYCVNHNCIEEIYGKCNENDNLEILNREITRQEVWKACSDLKRVNGMGCDWLHNIMVIEGKEILIDVLVLIFNKILNDGIHPDLWKLSEYVGMGKPKKDASDVNNLRALQLTSILDRIFQKIIAWRFISYFEINGYWDAATSAYLMNRSIEDVVLNLDEKMWQMLAIVGVLELFLFDLSKAFDSAWL